MKKSILAFACISAVAPSVFAQSVVDALQVSQSDFKGTARYMSMGGAFTPRELGRIPPAGGG